MIDMVGIGPFIIIPLVIQDMNGPQALFAWSVPSLLLLMVLSGLNLVLQCRKPVEVMFSFVKFTDLKAGEDYFLFFLSGRL